MLIFVRPARAEDNELFIDWYSKSDIFDTSLLKIPDIYLLCAFKKNKIIGFLVIEIENDYQTLLRFIPNPEASELEKAAGSFELVKQSIFLGYSSNLTKIYFQGSHIGTNKIACHAFKEVPLEEYQHIFKRTDLPVYLLQLKDLE